MIMAACGSLFHVYCCVLLSVNCSCVVMLCWLRMYKGLNENDIEKSFISYGNIHSATIFGREAIWNDIYSQERPIHSPKHSGEAQKELGLL